MSDDIRIKHIEVRTMASDKRSIEERGGGNPVGYTPNTEASVSKKTSQEKTVREQPPKPPSLE